MKIKFKYLTWTEIVFIILFVLLALNFFLDRVRQVETTETMRKICLHAEPPVARIHIRKDAWSRCECCPVCGKYLKLLEYGMVEQRGIFDGMFAPDTLYDMSMNRNMYDHDGNWIGKWK